MLWWRYAMMFLVYLNIFYVYFCSIFCWGNEGLGTTFLTSAHSECLEWNRQEWKCWKGESLRNLFVLSSCFISVVSLPTLTSLSDVINSSYSILWLWHMKIIKVNSEQKLHIWHCFLSGNWYFIWELNTFLPPKIWWLGTF